jgi:hypothetical protein
MSLLSEQNNNPPALQNPKNVTIMLTTLSRFLLKKLLVAQFAKLYGTQMFNGHICKNLS